MTDPTAPLSIRRYSPLSKTMRTSLFSCSDKFTCFRRRRKPWRSHRASMWTGSSMSLLCCKTRYQPARQCRRRWKLYDQGHLSALVSSLQKARCCRFTQKSGGCVCSPLSLCDRVGIRPARTSSISCRRSLSRNWRNRTFRLLVREGRTRQECQGPH